MSIPIGVADQAIRVWSVRRERGKLPPIDRFWGPIPSARRSPANSAFDTTTANRTPGVPSLVPLNLPSATRLGLNMVALLGVIVALHLGKTIFVPFVIAGLLAILLWPFTRWLVRVLRFPRFIACVTSLSGLVFLNAVLFVGMAVAVPSIVQDLPGPNDVEGQKKLYNRIRTQLQLASPVTIPEEMLPLNAQDSQLFSYVRKTLDGDYVTNALLDVSNLALAWFWQAVLILFITLFLLFEAKMLSDRVKEAFGRTIEAQGQVAGALDEMVFAVRNYILWRTLVNIGLGLVLGGIYHALGLRQAWTWAILTMILTYVPYLGTIAAGIPPLIDAFLYTTPMIAVLILILYTVIVTIEGYVIVPLVMGRSMDLNATTVILACLFWDLVWGTTGLFLAMPLMACIKAVCLQVEELRPWGNLMGTERGLSEQRTRERIHQIARQQSDPEKTVHMDAEEESAVVGPHR